ncbi:MAG: molybdopterin-dependent oxidoreductase [Nocardioides sp.]
MLSTPDGAALDRALGSLDFMAAVDVYVNETTWHADVILPPTTILERDHYDLVFHALAVRNTARFTLAVLPAGPDARHDWQIYAEIALRTAARLPARSRRRRLVQRLRLRTSPTRLVALLLRRSGSGVTLAALRRRPEGIDLGPLQAGLLPARLQTADGRLHLAPEAVLADLARVAAWQAPRPIG